MLRNGIYMLLAAASSAAVLAACAGDQSPTSETLTTEPVTGAEDGEIDEEAAEARADDLLGRSEDEVTDLPDVRATRRDGEGLDVHGDLRPGRMNLTVEEGVVVDVRIERDPSPPIE